MKKNITKALSVLLGTAVITGGIGAAAYAANSGEPTGAVKAGRVLSASKDSDGEVKKDETVYVIASSDGTVKKIIVSDWIKNSAGMTEISDRSDLDNIENVKGDEKYTPGGDNVKVWDAEGNDIYYQGSIEKELPVMISVSYMLDGKSISASDLAGKSGKVTIRFDYKNNQTVNGDFDIMAASVIKRLKKNFRDDNSVMILVLPYPVKDYEDYEKYYDEIVIPKELYGVHPKAAITERNRWMVTNTDVLVAYIRNESGGTAACVRMAEQLGRAIIKI